jgi:hypothetical protein
VVILWPKSPNRSCWFWGPIWETRRPWFWGSTKKPALLVSLYTVHALHSVIWPLDRLATEYLTCAWPSLVLCTKTPTPTTILVAAHHAAPVTYTSQDKQISTQTDRGRTTKISQIQTKARQLLIINQTKVRTTLFLTLHARSRLFRNMLMAQSC